MGGGRGLRASRWVGSVRRAASSELRGPPGASGEVGDSPREGALSEGRGSLSHVGALPAARRGAAPTVRPRRPPEAMLRLGLKKGRHLPAIVWAPP